MLISYMFSFFHIQTLKLTTNHIEFGIQQFQPAVPYAQLKLHEYTSMKFKVCLFLLDFSVCWTLITVSVYIPFCFDHVMSFKAVRMFPMSPRYSFKISRSFIYSCTLIHLYYIHGYITPPLFEFHYWLYMKE